MAGDNEAILIYRESTHTTLNLTCPYSKCNQTNFLAIKYVQTVHKDHNNQAGEETKPI